MLYEKVSMERILLPPSCIGHRAPIPQHIRVPVLAPTDTAILRFETPNATFHLVVGTGKILAVITQHEMRAQVGEHLQELCQALLLQFREGTISEMWGHLLQPRIQMASHRLVAHRLTSVCQAYVQKMFDLQHPVMHTLNLCKLGSPSRSLTHNGL